MSFANIYLLNLLWLLPLVIVAVIIKQRRKRQMLERFADEHLQERLMGQELRGLSFLKSALLIIAIALLIVAAAGPRWGSHFEEVSRMGTDIMLVVDVSPSMLVEDIKPNRLEQARRELTDFIRNIRGDRIGLVAFSGAAFLQCPLTLDYAAYEMFLAELNPALIPLAGTDIGAAIDTAIEGFDKESSAEPVIILITDGEDNEGRGLEAARKAAEAGVRIFIFGIGDPTGGPVPAEGGGFQKDREGNIILSRLDEKGLQKIADLTGGRYVRSVTGDLDLDLIYFSGIKSATKDVELKGGKIFVQEERFYIFILLAFVLLMAEAAIRERRDRA